MKKLMRNIIWYCYYVYDLLRCVTHKGKVRIADLELLTKVSTFVAQRNPKKVIIFAAYEKKPDDPYISFFLEGVGDALTIVINNTDRDKYGVDCLSESLIWVNRPNFGRDIAAYKLGIHSVLLSDLIGIEDVSLVNDSFFILRRSFFNFFRDDFPEEVLAHSYSQTPFPHARSYLLRIKPPLLDKLNSYLMNFPNARSRYNAVINGEVGMSQEVFTKYRIGIWAYSRFFNIELKNNPIQPLDIFYSADFSKVENFVADTSLSDTLSERLFLRSFLSDPYELARNSFSYIPDLIKREVFDKGLATKDHIYYLIEHSNLPRSVKRQVSSDILVPKRHMGLKTRLKMMIGEI